MAKYDQLNSITEYIFHHPEKDDTLMIYRDWSAETGYVISDPEFASLILELIANQKSMPNALLGEMLENEKALRRV